MPESSFLEVSAHPHPQRMALDGELTLLCFREQSVDGQWATAWGLGGFPEGSDGNKSARRARDLGSAVGWEDPLEKGVANYSRILAWRIPGAEEPGGLQSIGLQRVGHD